MSAPAGLAAESVEAPLLQGYLGAAYARPVAWDATLRFVEDALARPSVRADGVAAGRVVTIPAPAWDPIAVLFSSPELEEGSFFWQAPRGPAHAGLGAAHTVAASGPGRFQALEAARRSILGAVEWIVHPEVGRAVPPPRLFGGFAFEDGPFEDAPWAPFGGCSFVLPRFCFHADADGAWLDVAASALDLASSAGRAAIVASLRALGARATAPGAREAASPPRVVAERTAPSDARWVGGVDAIAQEIRAGRLAKVVAARRTTLELDHPVDPAVVLDRLGGLALASTRFAFRRGGATFLGASPELLVERRGARVFSEALAGTARDPATLATRKNLDEQAFVVDFIEARLLPFTAALERAPEPTPRRLTHVTHLVTPFHGILRPSVDSVAQLVEALHPTPAVNGVPAAVAARWIAGHEGFARGWYAGPVGWIDAAGDGEFRVALRSGLVAGRTAHLFAGAGIVAGSDAEAERREVGLKARTLRRALGVED